MGELDRKNNLLSELEKKEFQYLKWIEELGRVLWKTLPEHIKNKLADYRNRVWESTPENMKERMEIVENEAEIRWEIPQELEDFRKKWEEKIKWIDDKSKEKIVEAAETIPVKVETESDGSRLIEFKLWNKTWKILDPKLKTHSDDEYFVNKEYTFIRERDEWVKLWWMMWDDVSNWENKKLAKYVKEKEKEWLHIAKIEEMKAILTEIWESAGLDGESDQIAMLMYLTGMDWWYWLSMWDNESSGSPNSRSELHCHGNNRWFSCDNDDDSVSSLCMIACK